MSHTIVILGASGDLTRRKLIPALYRLYRKQRLPEKSRIVGFSRSPYNDDRWRTDLASYVPQFVGDEFDSETWDAFAANLFYHPGDIGNLDDFKTLKNRLDELEKDEQATRLYYLSTLPALYETAIKQLGAADLADDSQFARRIVIEKPFGHDLRSAHTLNETLHQVFRERQVYRIDHYLGKETVQNLLVLRFANSIFEPIWNRNYIDHVQITVAEEVDVGQRGGYYDNSGVLRDMFQNHLLQLMMITAMEAPVRFEADLVRDEKVKVLRSVRQLRGGDFARDTFRGQYDGYLQQPSVGLESQTATFSALKLHIDNWRWNNVPFYLRSGKAMSCRTTQIVIQFRAPPHMLFQDKELSAVDANQLVIQIQPAEGIQLHFLTKVPDAGMRLRLTDLDFRFSRQYAGTMPDAYQRLILDALKGDASLFARSDEVELSWSIVDPILAAWQSPAAPTLYPYESGAWGPVECTRWMEEQGRHWFDLCPVLR